MAKSTSKSNGNKKTEDIDQVPAPERKLSEEVIKEIMVQKNCSREEAIQILQNPAPHQ